MTNTAHHFEYTLSEEIYQEVFDVIKMSDTLKDFFRENANDSSKSIYEDFDLNVLFDILHNKFKSILYINYSKSVFESNEVPWIIFKEPVSKELKEKIEAFIEYFFENKYPNKLAKQSLVIDKWKFTDLFGKLHLNFVERYFAYLFSSGGPYKIVYPSNSWKERVENINFYMISNKNYNEAISEVRYTTKKNFYFSHVVKFNAIVSKETGEINITVNLSYRNWTTDKNQLRLATSNHTLHIFDYEKGESFAFKITSKCDKQTEVWNALFKSQKDQRVFLDKFGGILDIQDIVNNTEHYIKNSNLICGLPYSNNVFDYTGRNFAKIKGVEFEVVRMYSILFDSLGYLKATHNEIKELKPKMVFQNKKQQLKRLAWDEKDQKFKVVGPTKYTTKSFMLASKEDEINLIFWSGNKNLKEQFLEVLQKDFNVSSVTNLRVPTAEKNKEMDLHTFESNSFGNSCWEINFANKKLFINVYETNKNISAEKNPNTVYPYRENLIDTLQEEFKFLDTTLPTFNIVNLKNYPERGLKQEHDPYPDTRYAFLNRKQRVQFIDAEKVNEKGKSQVSTAGLMTFLDVLNKFGVRKNESDEHLDIIHLGLQTLWLEDGEKRKIVYLLTRKTKESAEFKILAENQPWISLDKLYLLSKKNALSVDIPITWEAVEELIFEELSKNPKEKQVFLFDESVVVKNNTSTEKLAYLSRNLRNENFSETRKSFDDEVKKRKLDVAIVLFEKNKKIGDYVVIKEKDNKTTQSSTIIFKSDGRYLMIPPKLDTMQLDNKRNRNTEEFGTHGDSKPHPKMHLYEYNIITNRTGYSDLTLMTILKHQHDLKITNTTFSKNPYVIAMGSFYEELNK